MRFVALIRAINVGVTAKLPMADLRELCSGLGWGRVRTYIQSGNVVFDAKGDAASLEVALERVIERRFGFFRPVLVRSAEQWRVYAAGSPFPEAEQDQANRLLLCLSKAPPGEGAAETLQARAAAGEQVRLTGDALWVLYPAGVGTSKLTPALFDKAAGSPVTARNWRTVLAVQEMLISGG
jgi:uncharacterized protein (DUF1697 family)